MAAPQPAARRFANAGAGAATASVAELLLDSLANGLAVTSAEGLILIANLAFRHLAGAAQLLSGSAHAPRLGRRLAGFVAHAAQSGASARLLSGVEGSTALLAFGHLLAIGPAGGQPVAVALVEIEPGPAAPERMSALFGLTPAEGRTVALVAHGVAPRDAARRLGVKLATVRTHLHHAYAKTGAPGQAALSRLLRAAGEPFRR
jgi:DNA-binding CsgD family transcriptional regulator